MHNDIDLGKYVRVVFRHYRLATVIFTLTVLLIGLALVFRPPQYTATATLFTRTPQYQWRFDSRVLPNVQTNKNWQKEFTEFAKDSWLKRTIATTLEAEYGSLPAGSVTVRAGKQSLIHVDAVARTPQEASDLANQWAQAFIEIVDNLYGTAALVNPFVEELQQTEAAYRQATEALREFKARTGIGIAAEGQTMLEGYEWLGPAGLQLAEKGRQLTAHNIALNNLHLLETQLQTATKEGRSLESLPWGLLAAPAIVERGQLSPQIALAHLDDVDRLRALIAEEISAQQTVAHALEQDLTEEQGHITQLSNELDRLVEDRILAKENYQTVRRKIDEITMQTKIDSAGLILVKPAVPPTAADAIDWMTSIAIAVFAGLVTAVMTAYLAEYFDNRRKAATPSRQ